MVGGVSPGKGGTTHLGLPVFNTVRDGGSHRRRCFRHLCAGAVLQGFDPGSRIDAGIKLIVTITEGIPTLDMLEVKVKLRGNSVCA
jgi:succinyl-CoA synthetase alpha subunit